jgi:hypothetical protein
VELMGNHTKIVPKQFITVNGVYKVKEEEDVIVELIPGDESLFIRGVTPLEILPQLCLVKTFEIHNFDENMVILWQVAEGVIGHKKMWRFGYDNKTIGKLLYEEISNVFLSKALQSKKSMLIIVSTESGKLVYREVIIF